MWHSFGPEKLLSVLLSSSETKSYLLSILLSFSETKSYFMPFYFWFYIWEYIRITGDP